MLHIFLVVTLQVYSWLPVFFLLVFHFCKEEMRYSSEDAPRTGERNVNLNKNTSENITLNMSYPDERAPNFILKVVSPLFQPSFYTSRFVHQTLAIPRRLNPSSLSNTSFYLISGLPFEGKSER